MSIIVTNLGFPRIGPRRELKFALESYWSGKSDAGALQETAAALRKANWSRQQAAGIGHIPSNDFSLYDHVLDTSVMVGAIPAIYGWNGGEVPLDTYFSMARGSQGGAGHVHNGHSHGANGHDHGVPALEMTKWFDTNYHFMVPVLEQGQTFALASNKPVDDYREAKALGIDTRPVLVGPVTYLKLAKSKDENFNPLSLLPGLIPVYIEVLRRLKANGAQWVQIDEPCLALDLDDDTRAAFRTAYGQFARALPDLKLLLTGYFGGYDDNLDLAVSLPVAGLHLDLARAPGQLETALAKAPKGLVLSLGVIDGRNVWRADLPAILDRLEPVVARRGTDHLFVAPSCSLLHTPMDATIETDLDPDLKTWLAFAVQKLDELSILGRAINQGRDSVKAELAASAAAAATRKTSPKIHDAKVQARAKAVTEGMARRGSPFAARRDLQRTRLSLPGFPTTTIDRAFCETRRNDGAARSRLRSLVEDGLRTVEMSEAQRASLHALVEERAVVTVTGQQIGMFGGPFYTLLKIASSVALARELTTTLDMPVVPVFWLEDNDHDAHEAATAVLQQADGFPVGMPFWDGDSPRIPVAQRTFGDDIAERLAPALAILNGQDADNVRAVLTSIYRPGTAWNDAFVQLLQ
ncbi:bacillithiol biosynthesis BshC, partial [bacterium]|nr:bacillithiol biosynthesis BshC [bacterium]